jgi:hypothetical protein
MSKENKIKQGLQSLCSLHFLLGALKFKSFAETIILASVVTPLPPQKLVPPPPRDASYRHFWSFPCCQSAVPHLLQIPLLSHVTLMLLPPSSTDTWNLTLWIRMRCHCDSCGEVTQQPSLLASTVVNCSHETVMITDAMSAYVSSWHLQNPWWYISRQSDA